MQAMALERLLHEPNRGSLVAGFRCVALENFAFLVDSAPQLDHHATKRITSGEELKYLDEL